MGIIWTEDQEFTVSSGYENGVLEDLSFDFSLLYEHIDEEKGGCFYKMHQGLLLLSFVNGVYEVHNPVTKEMRIVPRKDGHDGMMTPGIIIRLSTPLGCECEFMIVRLSCKIWKNIEVYRSKTGLWERLNLSLGNEGSDEQVRYQNTLLNYVALVDGLDAFLFLMLSKCGVVIKFRGQRTPERDDQYTFLLFEVVCGGIKKFSWDCGGTLHLSYHNDSGLSIWKHLDDYATSTQADVWEWVPLSKISNNSLIKSAFDSGHTVMPIAGHPDVAIVYLIIDSTIFAYDLTEDTVEKIVEVTKIKRGKFVFCFPYKPCLSLLNAVKLDD